MDFILLMTHQIKSGRLKTHGAKCHEVLLEEGEWNDRSEGFAEIMAICEECFKEIKNRNKNG